MAFNLVSDSDIYNIAERIRSGENLMTIVLDVMQLVEKMKNLHGVHKKRLVIDVIEDILIDMYGLEYYNNNYKTHMSDIIEFIIVISRSKVAINVTRKCSRMC